MELELLHGPFLANGDKKSSKQTNKKSALQISAVKNRDIKELDPIIHWKRVMPPENELKIIKSSNKSSIPNN